MALHFDEAVRRLHELRASDPEVYYSLMQDAADNLASKPSWPAGRVIETHDMRSHLTLMVVNEEVLL